MHTIQATTLAALIAVGSGLSSTQAVAAPIIFDGLTKISGANIDFYYDATAYRSASVSGDELRLGLQLTTGESAATAPQVIAVAHKGLGLRAEIGTGLQGSFEMTPYTSMYAQNAFTAYSANYVGNNLEWDNQHRPVTDVTQDYIWDSVSYAYQGDFSSSIFPQTEGNSRPDLTVSALMLSSNYLLSLGNSEGLPTSGSSVAVDSVTYSFQTVFPGDTPPVPEPSTYLMLLSGLAVCIACARRRTS